MEVLADHYVTIFPDQFEQDQTPSQDQPKSSNRCDRYTKTFVCLISAVGLSIAKFLGFGPHRE